MRGDDRRDFMLPTTYPGRRSSIGSANTVIVASEERLGGGRYVSPVPVPVFDGHNDVLLRLHQDPERDFRVDGTTGHLDLPRALRGGFAGGFFACFVPGPEQQPVITEEGYETDLGPPVPEREARPTAAALAARLFELEALGCLRVGRSSDDLVLDHGILAVLHLEGAEAIAGEDDLAAWHERGLRSLGLVWSRPNRYATGVPFRHPASPDTGPGLTDEGKALVRACNRLGVLVDLSHLNRAGFDDVARISEAPLVATHSNAWSLSPSTRNLEDDQLDAIASSGGAVGVNYAVSFLRSDGRLDADTPLAEIVRHVEYLAERMGVEHVALGSDFDGAVVPAELGDAAGLPALIDALGAVFTAEEVRHIAAENWLRVLTATWA
jgi:membrane dipeptidase